MRSLAYLAVVLALLALGAFVYIWESGRKSTEAGDRPADVVSKPEPPVRIKSFVFYELSPLGGRAVWAQDDRSATIQVFGPPPKDRSGLWERRFRSVLTEDQWAEVERLVGEHNFLALRLSGRTPIPDEAHLFVVVVTQAGHSMKVDTWAGKRHPQFDPIHEYLGGLCQAHGESVYEGGYEPEWCPPGFTAPWK